MKIATVLVVAAGCLVGGGLLAGAGDWPGFRGPGGDGVAADRGCAT